MAAGVTVAAVAGPGPGGGRGSVSPGGARRADVSREFARKYQSKKILHEKKIHRRGKIHGRKIYFREKIPAEQKNTT